MSIKTKYNLGVNPDAVKIALHYRRIYASYEAQIDKAVEEHLEYIEALKNYKADQSEDNRTALIDEAADISVMDEQVRLFAEIRQCEIDSRAKFKVERQLGRIENDVRKWFEEL